MADEELTKETQEVDETPHGESEATETDWKAEARKWERYAKKAQAAEAELEKLKQSQMTEQEREKARADAAEAELAALKAENERREAAKRIAEESDVPIDLLLFCSDEESMSEFAKTYGKTAHVSAAPSALGGSRIIRSDKEKRSNGDVFADVAEQFFTN